MHCNYIVAIKFLQPYQITVISCSKRQSYKTICTFHKIQELLSNFNPLKMHWPLTKIYYVLHKFKQLNKTSQIFLFFNFLIHSQSKAYQIVFFYLTISCLHLIDEEASQLFFKFVKHQSFKPNRTVKYFKNTFLHFSNLFELIIFILHYTIFLFQFNFLDIFDAFLLSISII